MRHLELFVENLYAFLPLISAAAETTGMAMGNPIYFSADGKSHRFYQSNVYLGEESLIFRSDDSKVEWKFSEMEVWTLRTFEDWLKHGGRTELAQVLRAWRLRRSAHVGSSPSEISSITPMRPGSNTQDASKYLASGVLFSNTLPSVAPTGGVEVGDIVVLQDQATEEQLVIRVFLPPEYFSHEKDKVPPGIAPDGIHYVHTDTPIGRQLPGKESGDLFTVSTQQGDTTYLVLEVRKLDGMCGHQEGQNSQEDTAFDEERSIYTGEGRKAVNASLSLDGSQYLGYISREEGRYGSFPLHDDYGDESDADGREYGDFSDDAEAPW